MATLRELKGRIGSVASSEKITGAMKMISSAKMHKAEQNLKRLVPYRKQIQSIIGHLLCADGEFYSPLTEIRDVKKIAVAVFGSDDGLCGAYNVQIFKKLLSYLPQMRAKYGNDVKFVIYPVGKKIAKIISKLSDTHIQVISNGKPDTRSSLDEIRDFTDMLKAGFIKGDVDKVDILYTHFKSVSKQIVRIDGLFPVSAEAIAGLGAGGETNRPYIFEPDVNTIYNSILPLYILSVMQEIAAENNASEQAARVMAMQSANDNAQKLLEELQLQYNNLRQQGITNELLDILGGQIK